MPGRLKFVHFDCCLAGRLRLTSDGRLVESPEGYVGMLAGPESDMSWALKMVGGPYSQFYQSWWGNIVKGEATSFNAFAVREWTKLKEGETLYSALQYAISKASTEVLKNFRMYGMGDVTAVKVE